MVVCVLLVTHALTYSLIHSRCTFSSGISRCSCSPVGVRVRVLTVDEVDELADEGAHVEGGVVGAEEVLSDPVQAVVVHL